MNEKNIEKMRRAAYKTDPSQIKGKPADVFFPENIEQIRNKIILGNNFVVRGGGSGLAGTDSFNSVIIDLSKINKILEINKDKKEIVVESGLILDNLNKFLEKYNLEFPIQPLSSSICTIGGIIATNASGFRELKYGRTSNWVLEADVVNGKGEIVKLNKAGIADIAGQEGITGVITRAKLKLINKKQRTASLFALENHEQIIDLVKKLRLMKNISMIFFLDKLSSSFIGFEDKYHILAEFESEEGKEKGETYDKLVSIIDKIYPHLANLGYTYIEDPKIFLDKFSQIAEFLEKNNIPYFGDLGSGVIHPCFSADQKTLINTMLDNIRKLHGKVTGKFGYGIKKKQYLDNIERKIITRLKLRFDPKFKINSNLMIDRAEKKELLIENNKQLNQEEVKMENIESEQEKKEKARAEKNIEDTNEKLDDEQQHKERVDGNEMEDNLAETVEE